MSWLRDTARPAVQYDVDDNGLIDHLMEQLFIYSPRNDSAAIMQNLDSCARERGFTRTNVVRITWTWYVQTETYRFPQEPSPEPTSAEDSTRSPSMQGSGSSDDTVDPAALGQRTTGFNLDTVD